MYRRIITSNGLLLGENFDILVQKGIIKDAPNSVTKQKWNALLKKADLFDADSDIDVGDLFTLLKCAFDDEFKTIRDVRFRTGYVYSADFENSIKHSDSSRAYSTHKTIYIDELLVSVLFEYIAVYYLWVTNKDSLDVYSFCFKKTLYLLDGCYRKGNLDCDTNKAEVIDMISSCCGENAPIVISDLYWTALAFAISHELAHIYLDHNRIKDDDKSINWKIEYDADRYGCDIVFNLIDKKYTNISSPFHEVFHS